ncbi:hypothetical protein, partial [Hoylesella timonensis]|uniref:hypothetical protein n=1 Tax=Hoylesella timonensis TaxID=386414 RepID=UPI0024308B74
DSLLLGDYFQSWSNLTPQPEYFQTVRQSHRLKRWIKQGGEHTIPTYLCNDSIGNDKIIKRFC